MFNFKKLRSFLAIALVVSMLFATLALSSCDILNSFLGQTTTKPGNSYNDPVLDPIDDNYRTLYQIYVRSFADSDGNGKGDIRGIIENFDYLNDGDMANGNDLGVQAIWLTPVFHGNSGHKYDAIDFYSIDPEFGTEEDLIELAELCEERNVKLILDLALNHTSPINQWFKESKKARINGDTSNKYYNYYCWSTTEKTGYTKVYGQNWWYECRFDPQGGSMPDLNYDNQNVRNEMLDVAKYWMNLGVDGFRFDAVKYIYYEDHTRSSAFYKWYTDELRKEYPDIYLIGECWDNETNMLKYYNSMNCFNFSVAGNGIIASAAKGSGAISTFVDNISELQKKILAINPNGMISSFLSNHDQDRSAGYIPNDNQKKMAASLYLLTPGTPVIYYGEEIGLKGSGDSAEDANRRLPMKWGDIWNCDVPNAQTYLSGSSLSNYHDYQNVVDGEDTIHDTVYEQQKDKNSLLNHYAKVLNIRHTYPAIARGTYSPIYGGKATFGGFLVKYQGDSLVILHNTSATETVTYNLSSNSALNGYTSFELLDFVGVNDASVEGTTLTLGPQTTVILK